MPFAQFLQSLRSQCRYCGQQAHTARGAAHFLRETVGRVRYAGASVAHPAGRQRLLHS